MKMIEEVKGKLCVKRYRLTARDQRYIKMRKVIRCPKSIDLKIIFRRKSQSVFV